MKESEIRPQELFDRYLALCEVDARTCFSAGHRSAVPCPACGEDGAALAFEKWGFGYAECRSCASLFQTPRPEAEEFARFYRDSPSSRYWAETFFPAVAEARRAHLFRPKVEEIARLCAADGFAPRSVADIGAGYGILLEEWRHRFPDTRTVAIEPNPQLAAVCRSKGLEVAECFLEEAAALQGGLDLVVGLEVIEHIHDPLTFCRSLRGLVGVGGRVLLTGLTVDGFDIQVLWDKSRSVSPPHHINLLSVAGFEALMGRSGFREVRGFTPGKLDLDIVRNAARDDPQVLDGHRFLRHLLASESEVQEEFQRFLSANRMSSHCWIWAR